MMLSYCQDVKTCRRALIGRHFGEQWNPNECHEMCDTCKRTGDQQDGKAALFDQVLRTPDKMLLSLLLKHTIRTLWSITTNLLKHIDKEMTDFMCVKTRLSSGNGKSSNCCQLRVKSRNAKANWRVAPLKLITIPWILLKGQPALAFF